MDYIMGAAEACAILKITDLVCLYYNLSVYA